MITDLSTGAIIAALDPAERLGARRVQVVVAAEEAGAAYERALELVHADAARRFLERRLSDLPS